MIAQVMPQVVIHLPVIVFVFCFGACVGSFMNVVVYRLPAGMSVIRPPSRCPICGAHLKFFRENLPILGWFMIRGKCRYCGARVSPQYMVVELVMALTFTGFYVAYFLAGTGTPWWGEVGGPWWTANGIVRAWPAFTALAFLVAGLVAMTLIDARTFTIPIQIPVFVTVAAFVAWPLQAVLPALRTPASMTWPIPATGWRWSLAAGLGVLGLLVSIVLLRTGRLRYSFADYDDYVREGEALADYPHARREMWPEILFLLPCVVLAVAGLVIGARLPQDPPPIVIQALGGSLLGYLVGGGLVWAVRILGTLGFGREAMGLGDVHLLAAVGAVLGVVDPCWIFFLAPFFGLGWVLLSKGLSAVFRRARRELPYGPHLAVATLVVLLARPAVSQLQRAILPGVPVPEPGLCQSAPRAAHAPPASRAPGSRP